MLCLTIILGLHCLMALTHQHSAARVTASLHTVIRTQRHSLVLYRVPAQHHCVKHRTINIIIDKSPSSVWARTMAVTGGWGRGVRGAHGRERARGQLVISAIRRIDYLDIYLRELARKLFRNLSNSWKYLFHFHWSFGIGRNDTFSKYISLFIMLIITG